MVERGTWQLVGWMPGSVRGRPWIEVGGDEAEIGGGENPLSGVAVGRATGFQLLGVGEFADVDFLRELPADRVVEVFVDAKCAAG